MDQQQIKRIVKENAIKPKHAKHMIIAFLSGGIMGVISHGLYVLAEKFLGLNPADAGAVASLSIVVIVSLLTIGGVYSWIAKRCGAGLFIPISGFANSVVSSSIESRFEGPIYGVGSRIFYLAGSVITYGIIGAFLYGCIRLGLTLVGVSL